MPDADEFGEATFLQPENWVRGKDRAQPCTVLGDGPRIIQIFS